MSYFMQLVILTCKSPFNVVCVLLYLKSRSDRIATENVQVEAIGAATFKYLGCTITDTHTREQIYIRTQNALQCAALHSVLMTKFLNKATNI